MDGKMFEDFKFFIVGYLEMSSEDIVVVDYFLGMGDVFEFIIDDWLYLKFSLFELWFFEWIKDYGGDVFFVIKEKDFIVYYLFELFDVVV